MAEAGVVSKNGRSSKDHSVDDPTEHGNDDPSDHPRNGKRARGGEAASKSAVRAKRRPAKADETALRNPKEEDAAATYAVLQRTFAEHLAMVRAEFREAVANYSVRVQGLLTHVDDSIADGSAALTPEERAHRTRALHEALKEIESLNLKPSKGRRRDLKKVETLAEHLGDIIDEW